MYQTYDVTAMLNSGKNANRGVAGAWWYATPLEWFQQPITTATLHPRCGRSCASSTQTAASNGSIAGRLGATTSAILPSELYDGETQDARQLQPG